MSLRSLAIESRYHKGMGVLESFYEPCLSTSKNYDRVSGYFSSAIFDIASAAFEQFFNNNGVYRIICSPILAADDSQALINSSSESRVPRDALVLTKLLNESNSRDTALILCYLIKSGAMELKLAVSDSLMHEKIGLFSDGDHQVSFSGSINESKAGWSEDGNLEYFDAFVSWDARDVDRLEDHADRFAALWNDCVQGVEVTPPSSALQSIIEKNAGEGKEKLQVRLQNTSAPFPYRPLDYQEFVLRNWKNAGRRGIVQFCTGAGKTVVGMLALKWCFSQKIPALVLVPSKTLLHQWADEIEQTFPRVRLLKAGDNNNRWKERLMLEAFLSASDETPTVTVATSGTASSDAFIKRSKSMGTCLLIADEVHNFGANRASKILELPFKYRLGLSATPDRYGDPEGTALIRSVFGEVLEPVIDIPTAIAKRRLVPYQYDFSVASLSDDEQETWDKLSKQISRLAAQGAGFNTSTEESPGSSQLQMLVLRRARVAKKASAKLELGLDVFRENYQTGQRWLVFLEDSQELELFKTALTNMGLSSMRYDSDLSTEERKLTVDHLTSRGGIVLSMRCLDEGVDIPSISHALILASSQNPRQFVQRRGRVLRFAGEQKKRAYIWDVMAMPKIGAEDTTRALILAEFGRSREFAQYAENASGVMARLNGVLARHGLLPEDIESRETEAENLGLTELDKEDAYDRG